CDGCKPLQPARSSTRLWQQRPPTRYQQSNEWGQVRSSVMVWPLFCKALTGPAVPDGGVDAIPGREPLSSAANLLVRGSTPNLTKKLGKLEKLPQLVHLPAMQDRPA